MLSIVPIEAFNDNYIWLFYHEGQAIVVDPGEAAPVDAFLQQHALQLTAILVTHHHADHIGGVGTLLDHYPDLNLFGPATLPYPHTLVQAADRITLLGYEFTVMAVPGHTLDHLAYYSAPTLFCGDTLFGAGCGRLFEGSAQQMYASLMQLAALPPDTLIYPAHEYTLANLQFSLMVEPDNPAIGRRFDIEKARRDQGLPTLPTTLASELFTNPFLRIRNQNVRQAVQKYSSVSLQEDWEIFQKLRSWKDRFRPIGL